VSDFRFPSGSTYSFGPAKTQLRFQCPSQQNATQKLGSEAKSQEDADHLAVSRNGDALQLTHEFRIPMELHADLRDHETFPDLNLSCSQLLDMLT